MPIDKEDGFRLIKSGASFTTLPNESISAISNPVSLAIWVHLCSKPKDWIVRRSEIMERFDIGRDKYQICMRELREHGLVWDYQIRDDMGNFLDKAIVCSTSIDPLHKHREPENPVLHREPENPNYGKPELRQIRPLSKERIITNEILLKKEILIPLGINIEAWDEWVDYRKKKSKSISPMAAKKQFKMLLEYSEITQAIIINNSIQNDYQGLFPIKGDDDGKGGKTFRSKSDREYDATLATIDYERAIDF